MQVLCVPVCRMLNAHKCVGEHPGDEKMYQYRSELRFHMHVTVQIVSLLVVATHQIFEWVSH